MNRYWFLVLLFVIAEFIAGFFLLTTGIPQVRSNALTAMVVLMWLTLCILGYHYLHSTIFILIDPPKRKTRYRTAVVNVDTKNYYNSEDIKYVEWRQTTLWTKIIVEGKSYMVVAPSVIMPKEKTRRQEIFQTIRKYLGLGG